MSGVRAIAVVVTLLASVGASAKDSAAFGVYLGAGCGGVERLAQFERWFGREPDQVIEFIGWPVLEKGTTWGVRCWSKAGKKVVFSLPMLPSWGTLGEGASGKYDTLFRNYGEELVKHGFADSVIRPGWEFNADWYPWAAKRDPKAWVGYWRRIVTTMRSVPGSNFKFDWCAAGGWSKFRAESVYPGDEYVDIIGLDFYNMLDAKSGEVSPEQRWAMRKAAPHGLDWHRSFALAHNKPMSFPEWGTGTSKQAKGGDDDPYFIEQMAKWIKENRVAYHNYWDFSAPILDSRLSSGKRPAAGIALIRAFGDERKSVRGATHPPAPQVGGEP